MNTRASFALVMLVVSALAAPAHASGRGCTETGRMIGYRRCMTLAFADDSQVARWTLTPFLFYAGLEPGARFAGNARTLSDAEPYAFDPTRQGNAPLHFGGGGLRIGGFAWRGLSIAGEVRVGLSTVSPRSERVSPTLRALSADQAGYFAIGLYSGYTVSLGWISLRGEVGAGVREAWVNTLVQYGEELGASGVHALHVFGAARALVDVFVGPNNSLTFGAECDFLPMPALVATVGFTHHGRAFDLLR